MPVKHFDWDPRERINEIKKELAKLPTIVANTGLNHFLNNFKTESWDGQKWKKRSNWSNRKEADSLLNASGQLIRSLTSHTSGANVKVFVKAPANKYADAHNFGGTITIPANKKTEKWAWRMFYMAQLGTEKSFYKAIALRMKSGKSMTVKMPKRQFIGESEKLNTAIKNKWDKFLEAKFK
jgi:phage gpG-like protein